MRKILAVAVGVLISVSAYAQSTGMCVGSPCKPVTTSNPVPTTVTGALPAGANMIGHVVVDTAPSTPVTISSLPSLAAGANAIGTVGVTALPALPTGTNAIGHVTVDAAPTTPVNIAKARSTAVATAVTCATSATAAPASVATSRLSLCIANTSTETEYLGPSGVTSSTGFPLTAGSTWCDDVGAQPYYCVSASGTATARTLEN